MICDMEIAKLEITPPLTPLSLPALPAPSDRSGKAALSAQTGPGSVSGYLIQRIQDNMIQV